MCSRVNCKQCGKPSYAGCGAHIEQVLGDVAKDDRCKCREAKREAKTGAAGEKPSSLLSRLFGL
jgi:hypothetical protein